VDTDCEDEGNSTRQAWQYALDMHNRPVYEVEFDPAKPEPIFANTGSTFRSITVRKDYDFSKRKARGCYFLPGKTRITIMLDDDVIEHFRERAEAEGIGYQTKINAVLRAATLPPKGRKTVEKPITEAALRKILREELREAG
jgi:uncharacterized protein (DUF4415 family)